MKSPFIIEQDFISPYLAEDIVDALNFSNPDIDITGIPLASTKFNEDIELVIFENLQDKLQNFEEYYNVNYKGTSEMEFGILPQGYIPKPPSCSNSQYIENKWKRTSNNDFTGVLFLSDFNDKPPFSSEFEVYGSKLEFKFHNFGFNPERGTLILFPSGSNFLHTFSSCIIGDAYYVKFTITCKENFVYNRHEYQGNYKTWFETIA